MKKQRPDRWSFLLALLVLGGTLAGCPAARELTDPSGTPSESLQTFVSDLARQCWAAFLF